MARARKKQALVPSSEQGVARAQVLLSSASSAPVTGDVPTGSKENVGAVALGFKLRAQPEVQSEERVFRALRDETCPKCEGEGDVVGVEAPLGGVAQVIFHGVQVVEVGVQVRVHQDRGVEEDGEGQVEVEREVEEVREKRTSWMTWREDKRHMNDLSQCGVTHHQ